MELWGLVIIGGPLVLAVAIAYALLRRRRLTPGEKAAQDAATRRNYAEPER